MRRWIVFASLFVCSISYGVVALVHQAISDTCSTTITSSTSGNLLVVFCEAQDTNFATAVADNASGGSNTYTEIVGSHGNLIGVVAPTSIWYSQTTHGGATTVTCTSASDCYGSGVSEYSGALISGSPVDTSSGSLQTASIGTICTGAPVTTSNSGDVIFTAGIPLNGLTAVNAPYTDFLGGTGNGQATADYIPGSIVTTSSASWTCAVADAMASSVAAFLPAAGGGGGTPTDNPRQVITIESQLRISGGCKYSWRNSHYRRSNATSKYRYSEQWNSDCLYWFR